MSKGTLVGLVLVLAVIVGGIMIATRKNEPIATLTPIMSESPSPSISPTATPLVAVSVKVEVKPATVKITYTDQGFAPAIVTIKKGDTVTWLNKGTKDMWPASAQHPTHGAYPESGGCLESKFDACVHIVPGQSWSFIFNQIGEWGFHDHLTPQFFGNITVQ